MSAADQYDRIEAAKDAIREGGGEAQLSTRTGVFDEAGSLVHWKTAELLAWLYPVTYVIKSDPLRDYRVIRTRANQDALDSCRLKRASAHESGRNH